MLKTTRTMNTYLKVHLKAEFGISPARFDVMAQLSRAEEPVMMSDISQGLMVTGGNVTSLIDGMERDGLVIRQHSKTDRRVTAIGMTAAGKALFDRASVANKAWVNALLSDVSAEELQELLELLVVVRSSARRASGDKS